MLGYEAAESSTIERGGGGRVDLPIRTPHQKAELLVVSSIYADLLDRIRSRSGVHLAASEGRRCIVVYGSSFHELLTCDGSRRGHSRDGRGGHGGAPSESIRGFAPRTRAVRKPSTTVECGLCLSSEHVFVVVVAATKLKVVGGYSECRSGRSIYSINASLRGAYKILGIAKCMYYIAGDLIIK